MCGYFFGQLLVKVGILLFQHQVTLIFLVLLPSIVPSEQISFESLDALKTLSSSERNDKTREQEITDLVLEVVMDKMLAS